MWRGSSRGWRCNKTRQIRNTRNLVAILPQELQTEVIKVRDSRTEHHLSVRCGSKGMAGCENCRHDIPIGIHCKFGRCQVQEQSVLAWGIIFCISTRHNMQDCWYLSKNIMICTHSHVLEREASAGGPNIWDVLGKHLKNISSCSQTYQKVMISKTMNN